MKSAILTLQAFKNLVKKLRECRAYARKLEKSNNFLNSQIEAYKTSFTKTKDI